MRQQPSHQRTRVLLMASSMRGGGSEHQVALLAEHLPRDQFDVHLFLTHRTGELLDRLPDDVAIHSLEPLPSSLGHRLLNRWPGRVLRSQAAGFRKIIEKHSIDVVYDRAFHNTLIAGHPSVVAAGCQDSFRRVSTIVSPPAEALPTVEKRFVEAKRKRLAFAYKRSDVVVAVSQAVADSAADYYGLDRTKIEVILNPVDVDAVRRYRTTDGVASNPDYLTLVCVGRMSIEKGQLDLIEAIAKLPCPWPNEVPRLRIQFIGNGPMRGQLERRVAEISGSDGTVDGHRIEFAGTVSPALSRIAAADGLVCPSHFEGMPNVVLEAFALEVPVIATDAGGTVELAAHEGRPTLWSVPPRAPELLAGELFAFVNAPQEREVRKSSALDLVRDRHSIRLAISQVGDVLCRVGSAQLG